MNAAAGLVEVRVPDMGNFKDVAVIDVLVKPGDTIETDGSLVTLETEKATMDVPSTAAGVIEKMHVAKGGKVSPGDLIATVRSTGAAAGASAPAQAPAAPPAAAAPPPAPAKAAPAAAPAAPVAPKTAAAPAAAAPAKPASAAANGAAAGADLPPINEPGFSRAHAGPSVRKFARELGVDLTRVSGTGFKTRITHDDVKAFVKKALSGGGAPASAPGAGSLPTIPPVDFSLFGPVESKPLSRIQKISGPRLHASWVNIPHVTQFDEADITELEELRNRLKQTAQDAGIKLTPLAFIVRACVKALQQFPQFNASLDPTGTNLILKKYFNIGFAADTPNGLVVPVVKDANQKDIYKTARALAELSEAARTGKLKADQMQGGCFTISSLGGIGGTAFTPIINAPEVAILGVSRSSMKPVYKDGAFVPRLMLPLSLSYDHRVIDGASAARFTTYLAQVLSTPGQLAEALP
ncbi:MAG TPA: dihydrolipoyllysine-residue acetyltransferase [Steroidobacteraceae bacterium]|jgi:pyruvate dehydrogenase E2 component (dihydrolipoamide acetyltransferase)